jgi:hypothetical protein
MQFIVTDFAAFQAELAEMSHATLTAEIVETNEETIMPLHTGEEL